MKIRSVPIPVSAPSGRAATVTADGTRRRREGCPDCRERPRGAIRKCDVAGGVAPAFGGDSTPADGVPDGDIGHVPDANRHPVMRCDHDLRDLLDGGRPGDALHEARFTGAHTVAVGAEARSLAYRAAELISFSGARYRRDIAEQVAAHV